jgi:hypothetical protein
MSRAEDIFGRLIREGAAAVDEFIVTRQSEELFLDFKRSKDSGSGKRLDQDDRNSLGRAISGFANSEGGVIVWGVDCKGGPDGADVPSAIFPLVDSDAFVSRLEGAVSGCTIPPCTGVRSVPIHLQGGPGGFAATYVPRSNLAPHQHVASGTQGGRYYIRAGSTFFPAPHGVLAGLFGRRPEPFVYPLFFSEPIKCLEPAKVHAKFAVVMVSDGPGIARDIFITLDLFHPGGPSTLMIEPSNLDAFDLLSEFGYHTAVTAKDSFKLPPGGRVEALIVHCRLEPPFQKNFLLTMNYGCTGSPTRQIRTRHEPGSLEAICLATAKLPPEDRVDFFGCQLFGAPGGKPERSPWVEER